MVDVFNTYFEDDSDDDVLAELFLNSRKEKKIRARPDLFNTYDDDEFRNRFRLSKEGVIHILHLINHQLVYGTDRNHAVTPINQLLLTLRLFACADMLIALGDFGGIHKSTACRIVHKVSRTLAGLAPKFIKLPETNEEIKKAHDGFFKVAKFPRIVGAMDCTHIKIIGPGGENGENFRGRKDYFSINVQTVCDAELRINDIVASWPGATHDQTIFNNSSLKARMEMGQFGNSVLLADSGYAVTNYLIPPISNPSNPAESLFNESQIRTRNRVERSYGVWKRRFPILALGIRFKTERVEAIIVACAVLHNIAIERREVIPNLSLDMERMIANDLHDDPETRNRQISTDGRLGVRNLFIQYFHNLIISR